VSNNSHSMTNWMGRMKRKSMMILQRFDITNIRICC